ncbi:HNH endonuclease [Silvimonas iriomotensis]|uniref:HNH endonuclease n=1 Tax=Silvimonas iriomotensis TaxID=449662 RepID=UPI0016693464|nr:HNH endonuclease [Silvimonas iriomotensis]
MRLSEYCRFKPVTNGERLFQFLILNVIGKERASSLDNVSLIQIGGRTDDFADYYAGIFASNLMMRCIKKAKWIDRTDPLHADNNALERHKRELVNYFLTSLEIPKNSLGGNLEQLANYVIDAYRSSKKDITHTVRKQFKRRPDNCYICGVSIDDSSQADQNYELEHIWPQSYGGDSIEGNLLPSCSHCNKEKSHMLLWQNSDVSSFVMMPQAEPHELRSIHKSVRIARHRRLIFEYACSNKLTLKEAAVAIGSVELASPKYIDKYDSIDFYNIKFF